ncbi:DUF4360 domain-containing protein [Amycolatopsis echigonensis]|uniref:DUF4360 domain-containing protein n=1 Tax=Amycolatopsis echigonensis TaxID=2576905 RepID=A0A8E1W450_9PSEU|nr:MULTISPECIES: DUF4360 domain-containing protein [Amycolatopsis]MBB2503511.1 DUF4360 domain-containing protein [Amycolatopsis echigonensis]
MALSSTVAPHSWPQNPPLDKIIIDVATVTGTGCPPDTAAVSVSADYRGFGHLENGAYGVERANYYFQGNSPTAYETHRLDGFYDNDWRFSDSTDIDAIIYEPCGQERNLNLNTELRAYAGTSDPAKTTSFLTTDSTDGSVQTVYRFAWKSCPAVR